MSISYSEQSMCKKRKKVDNGTISDLRFDDQHGLGSKPTCVILLCPWERHFTVLSPAWWS